MRIIEFDIQQGCSEKNAVTKNILLIFNLEKELRIVHNEYESILNAGDILLLNEKTSFRRAASEALFVEFEIDSLAFKNAFSKKRCHFFCDSTVEKNDNYGLLRSQLTQLLQSYYEHPEYREAILAQQSYSLLIFLVSNFSTADVIENTGSVADQLLDYIDRNYQEELSLKQISDDFHMSPQYFSKFFKTNIGTNYYKYLSTVRLEHATQALLSSDSNLLHIALESGFPNAESFYRYFQEAYNVTPQEYRTLHRKERKQKMARQKAVLAEALQHLQHPAEPTVAPGTPLIIDSSLRNEYSPFWTKIVNIGSFANLKDADIRTHLDILQKDLHFKYARLLLDLNRKQETGSYFVQEQVLDYLQSLGLNFWLVIDFSSAEQTALFDDLSRFLSHMANRYGVEGIRRWRFELLYNAPFQDRTAEKYWDTFVKITRIMNRFGCYKLVGAGLPLGDIETVRKFYEQSPPEAAKRPFQTLQSEPYTNVGTSDEPAVVRTTDRSYMKNRILSLRKNVPFFSQPEQGIYITSWHDSLMNHNIFNDSCYRGAEIIKNVIDCMDQVKALTLQMPLDAMDDSSSQNQLLFGADGLITRNGIKKPSFYSYAFLSHAGEYYLTRDSHSIVFSNGSNYQIICHNCKRKSFRYYLDEESPDLDKFSEYFDDMEPIQLNYRIKGIENGTYILKIRTVSTEYGSVQDALHRMVQQKDVYIHPNDIHYLRQVSVPRIQLKKLTVTDGCADLSIALPANAFAHIHVIYQY